MIISKTEKIEQIIQKGGLTFFCCMMSVIILPFHVDFLPPFMILWVICWIFENYRRIRKIPQIKEPSFLLFVGFLIYFLWYLAGLFYTNDLDNGVLLVFRRLSFIVFPLMLFYPGETIKKKIRLLLKIFSISTLLYMIVCFCLALFRSVYFSNGIITFNPHPQEYDYANYFFGTDFAFSQHPTYLAMYVLFSVFISFESFFDHRLKTILKVLWLVSGIILLTSLYFISSRAGILTALILIPLYFILRFKYMKKLWISVIIIAVAIPLLIFSFFKNERIKYYLPEGSKSSFVEKFMLDNRIPIWKSALKVIDHNLVIGVGAGDASNELKREYKNAGYTEMYYDNLNAHNQYIEVLLGTGLIGLLIFVSILSFIIYLVFLKRSLLFGLFILIIMMFFLFESILNRIAGVTFFSLFSFLLLYLDYPDSQKAITRYVNLL
jgi:O-antigen ligase